MKQERTTVIIGELDCSEIDQSFFDALLAIIEKDIESDKSP